MRNLVTNKIKKWCQSITSSHTLHTVQGLRDENRRLKYARLSASLFSIISAGLVFTDPQVVATLPNELSLAFVFFFLGSALILLILTIVSYFVECVLYMAEYFFKTVVNPALLPVALVAIFLKIIPVLQHDLPLAEGITWFFVIFLLIYSVSLILFMGNTKPLWILRLKVGTLMLIAFAVVTIIQMPISQITSILSSQELSRLVTQNEALRQDAIIFLCAAFVSLVAALIIEWTLRPRRTNKKSDNS